MMFILLCLMSIIIASGGNMKNGTCKPMASCSSGIDHQSLAMNCGCDQSCVVVGDCCHDYVQPSSLLSKVPKVECLALPMVPGTYNFLLAMVQKCPPDFEDAFIKIRCESVRDNLPFTPMKIARDVLFYVPVVGHTSQLLYTNIYCAVCNQERHSFFLNVDIRNRRPMTIKQLSNLKDISKFNKVFPRSQVTMSHECYKPRPCRLSVKSCKKGWLDDDTKRTCRYGFASYVYGRIDSTIYHNKQCAFCNDVDESKLTCRDPRMYLSNASGFRLLPYSLLFDLNTGVVSSREPEDTTMKETGVLNKKTMCLKGEIYDPFSKLCVSIPQIYHTEIDDSCMPVYKNIRTSIKDTTLELQESTGSNISGDTYNCADHLPQLLRSGFLNKTLLWRDSNLPYANVVENSEYLCITLNDSQNNSWIASRLGQHDTRLARSASYLTIILNVLSILGLGIQIVIYSLFACLRNTPGKCLICLSTALMTSQILFSFALGMTTIKVICYGIALLLHDSLLTYFSWMSVLSFDIWHTFQIHARGVGKVNNDNRTVFLNYSIFAFGFPLLTVTVSAILDSLNFHVKPDYGQEICWFGQSEGLFYLFVIPVAFTVSANAIFLILTIHNIVKVSETTQVARANQSKKERNRFYLYVKLTFVMGVTWIIAFIAMATKRQEVWYLFIILNSLQGVWIFLSFVCTRKVCRLVTASCSRRSRKKGSSSQYSIRSKNSASITRQTAPDSFTCSSTGNGRSHTNSFKIMSYKWTSL